MTECPFCRFQPIEETATYCTNCGAQLFLERRQTVYERLKFLGGESRIITAVFINFTGFEKLVGAEKYQSAIVYLYKYLEEISDVIRSFDGTANKILPDFRVLGIFGAPKAHPDDILRSARCAFEVRSQWQKKKSAIKDLQEIDITIGINTGRTFFGYVLEDFLTVIGDTINTASRLAEICPAGEIIISKDILNKAIEYLTVEDFGKLVVKGKREKITTYLLKGLKEDTFLFKVIQLPIFGRNEELRKLSLLAGGTVNKNLTLGIVNGQMGIGKTKLKEEFEGYLSKQNLCNFLEAQCVADVQSPYYPFKAMLKNYFGLTDFENREVAKRKVNRVCGQLGLSPVDTKGLTNLLFTDLKRIKGEEMKAINEEIHISMKNLIQHESERRPLVLIFEDFNRADPMSKDLIIYLALELKNFAVMFLMVNPPREFLSNISEPIEEINLAPLSYEDVQGLVRFLLDDVDDKLVEFIYRAAGGNPMFTIEAIRNTRRTKLIKEVSGRWYLEKEQRLAFLDDLYGVVMSTIDSLPPNYRLLIDYASVIGYSFNKHLLEEIFEDRDITDRLDYLVGEGYFVLSEEGVDPVFIFRHNLLKDAAYSVVPLKKRKEIHQKVAVLLEKTYANRLADFYEDISYHYYTGENWQKAAIYYKFSGDKAKNLFAIDQAFSFYNTVLKIKEDQNNYVSSELTREILLNLTDLYEITGDVQKMAISAEQGLKNAQQDKDLKSELLFLERQGYATILENKFDKAEELFLTGIQKCDNNMPEISTMLYAHLGFTYALEYEYEKSLIHYNLSWNTARNNNIKDGEVLCLFDLAHLHQRLGNYEQALEYLNYGLESLISSDELRRIAQFRYLVAEIDYAIGNLDKTKETLSAIFTTAETIGHFEIFVKAGIDLALVNAISKNESAAAKYLEQIDKKITLFARENLLAEINFKKAQIYYNFGDHNKARDYLMTGLKLAQKYNQKEIECGCLVLLSDIDEGGRYENARKALAIAETIKLPPVIVQVMYRLSEIFIENNDLDKGRYYATKALVLFDGIKSNLKPENQEIYGRRREYLRLLEI